MYFLRGAVYYRFHRIHSRTLFLHSPSSIRLPFLLCAFRHSLSPCRLHMYIMSNHEPSKENAAMAMEATGIGRMAGQLGCHQNEYNYRPEIADSDQNSI